MKKQMHFILLILSVFLIFNMLYTPFISADSGVKSTDKEKSEEVLFKNGRISAHLALNEEQIMTDTNLKSLESYFKTTKLASNSGRLDIRLNPMSNVKLNQENAYTAKGRIKIGNVLYRMKAEGSLDVKELEKNRLFYAGHLFGKIYEKDGREVDELVLSVQYSPKSNQSKAIVVIGTDSEERAIKPLILSFGKQSEENRRYFEEKLKEQKEKEKQKENDDAVLGISTPINTLTASGAAEQGMPLAKAGAYGTNSGNILYIAGYHFPKVRYQSINQFAIRMWGNTINAEAYLRNQLGKNVVSNSTVTQTVKLGVHNAANWDYIASAVPENSRSSITVPIPINFPAIGLQVINLNIPVQSCTFSATNKLSSPTRNFADWTMRKYLSFFDSTIINPLSYSSTPWHTTKDNKGFGATVNYSYINLVNSNVTKSVTFTGTIYYQTTIRTQTGTGYDQYTYPITKTVTSSIIVTP